MVTQASTFYTNTNNEGYPIPPCSSVFICVQSVLTDLGYQTVFITSLLCISLKNKMGLVWWMYGCTSKALCVYTVHTTLHYKNGGLTLMLLHTKHNALMRKKKSKETDSLSNIPHKQTRRGEVRWNKTGFLSSTNGWMDRWKVGCCNLCAVGWSSHYHPVHILPPEVQKRGRKWLGQERKCYIYFFFFLPLRR